MHKTKNSFYDYHDGEEALSPVWDCRFDVGDVDPPADAAAAQ